MSESRIQALVASLLLILTSAGLADTSPSLTPEQFVSAWPIHPVDRAPAYRIELTEEIMNTLADPEGRDLALVDRHDRPISLYRLGHEALIETRRDEQSLAFTSRWLDGSLPSDSTPLYLRLEQGEQTLLIRGQSPRPAAQQQPLRFEALMALPTEELSGNVHELQMDWWTERPLNLTCWLGDATEGQAATIRLSPRLLQDGFPRQYRAVHRLAGPIAAAMQLHCFGQRTPGDQDRFAAFLLTQQQVNHATSVALPAEEVHQANGTLQFSTPGPWRLNQVQIELGDESWSGQLGLHTANYSDGPWRLLGRHQKNALEQPRIEIVIPTDAPRARHWKLTFDPPIVNSASLALTANPDSLTFLHQGEPPWRLLAGSRETRGLQTAMRGTMPLPGAAETAWTLPQVRPGAMTPSGGPDALVAPEAPIDWAQRLLWLVLLAGGLLVVMLAWRLLRQAEKE
ncbi:MAG: DUF3999 family protein [Wenzhouxiangella sp.]